MRYGSLFAGAGGFDLGFDAAGWECAWQVEIDPHARKVLAHWWPEVPRHDDITRCVGAVDVQLASGRLGEDGHRGESTRPLGEPVDDADPGHLLGPVDLIVGGFPCQDLSVAGKRAGMERGTRSGLFYEFARIVEEMRDATAGTSPRWVVWENVAGLLSLGNTLGSVYAEWDRIGAVVQEHRLIDTGRAFGVPQRRRRVLGVVGFDPRAESAPPVLAEPEGVRRDPAKGREAGKDVAGTLGGGSGGRGWAPETDRMTFLPTTIGTLSPGAHPGGLNGQDVYSGQLVPFHPTQDPITSIGHTHALGATGDAPVAIATDLAVRRLTPTECERLMGWPDGHTAPAGADSHRYRLCGNGVIAPAAEWLARRIEEAAS